MQRQRSAFALLAASAGASLAAIGLTLARTGGGRIDLATVPISLVVVGLGVLGALIVRRTGNVIGWIVLVISLALNVSFLTEAYVFLGVERSLQGVSIAGWLNSVSFTLVSTPWALLFLLFPTGRPPTPRWRASIAIWVVGAALVLLWSALKPTVFGHPDLPGPVVNPLDLRLPNRLLWAILETGVVLSTVAGGLSVVALFVRFRRARGEERQQIRWLAFVVAALTILFLFLVAADAVSGDHPQGALDTATSVAWVLLVLMLAVGVPVAMTISILKYRLYDLDVVVKRTVVFGVLVVLLLAVGGLGALVLGGSLVPSLYDLPPLLVVFGAAMGLLVLPFYRLANRIADRLVYGGRTSPYEAMATFAHRVGDTYANEDVLIRMATILRETTRARSATVWLSLGGAFRPAATAGEPADDDLVPGTGSELPPLPGDHASPVRHQGDLLGALTVVMPASDPVDRARAGLIDDLASQAGAVLRNVRLIEELRASRQRLVAAQDEERRRIERNLHDGAQQQLVALAVQLRLLEGAITKDPPKAQQQTVQLQAAANDALELLRDLARGIYPPLLADKGLAAALEAQARKAHVPTAVEADGIEHYAQEIESAVYFSCLEALQNVAKYADASKASIRLAARDGTLSFEVADDGHGFDPSSTPRGSGLQGIADRLDAIGGSTEIRSAPGEGTTVAGRVPVEAAP